MKSTELDCTEKRGDTGEYEELIEIGNELAGSDYEDIFMSGGGGLIRGRLR